MLRSGATLLVILKGLGAAHHYERSPSTNCIKPLTSDRWCEKRKVVRRDGVAHRANAITPQDWLSEYLSRASVGCAVLARR